MMKRSIYAFLFVALLGLSMLPSAAWAGPTSTVTVQVGYADNLRPSPFLPTNLCNGGSQFDGSSGATCSSSEQFDAGAIKIINNTGGTMVVSDVKVNINGSQVYDLWNGGGNFDIGNGTSEVLSQTFGENFDTSDNGTTFQPGDGFQPTITITFTDSALGTGTQVLTFTDTGQVLNTGGFDSVQGINLPGGGRECIGGNNNSSNGPGSCNESLQWRDVGTAGFTNPGGAPEPSTIVLLLTGAAALVGVARRYAA
ncbi:MAG TPA: PEP-CTERM sorting domain-containing protein [Candidatus Acidoferrales bacterium]|nr:PEP-CTERM sorting domain-containing protein [Candidatus Acidoferrales bacterium]